MRQIVVFTGPPGAGKNTLIDRLVREYRFAFPIPHTSRPPREYERPGMHYHFESQSRIIEMIRRGEFVIWTFMLAHYYGYHRDVFYEAMSTDKHLALYMSGCMAMEFRRKYIATMVFLKPPSEDFAAENMRKRNKADDMELYRRHFHSEDLFGYIHFYDVVVEVEKDTESTFKKLVQQLGL